MAERKQGHRFDEVVAYHDELLTAAERAEMEAHLKSCPECRADLAEAQRVLDAVDRRAAAPPEGGYSTDDLVAMMTQKTAELDRAGPRRKPQGARRTALWLGLGLAAAAALVALLFLTRSPPPNPRQEIAPREHKRPAKRLAAPRPP